MLALLLQGCVTYTDHSESSSAGTSVRVDFGDVLLNRRQVFLFGSIDQRVAELTIQKLLYLDAQSALPIDLYMQTPGGEIMHAMAIERTMRLMKAPVNTYALYECNSGGALLLAAGTGKRRAFADAIIVAVRPESATVRIERGSPSSSRTMTELRSTGASAPSLRTRLAAISWAAPCEKSSGR